MREGRFGKIRDMVWPRMGLRRYSAYLRKRILRLSASPHAIAAGVASGAAVSMFPLVGLHFLLGFVLAYFTRGNMLAAALGTAWGNPVTFPVFFAVSFAIGDLILGLGGFHPGEFEAVGPTGAQLSQGLFSEGLAAMLPTFLTMLIGALPMALAAYAGFYFLVRWAVIRFRARRAAKRSARRIARREAEEAGRP